MNNPFNNDEFSSNDGANRGVQWQSRTISF